MWWSEKCLLTLQQRNITLHIMSDFTGLRNELNYAVMADGTVRLLGNLKKPMTVEEVYAAKNA